jgi:hypothetical protein
MKTLAELIGQPSADAHARTGFLARFGMERNPFPTARTILPAVMYNQDKALREFAGRVQAIMGDAPQKRSMAVIGGTGGGKSHFLRHCQFLFEEYVKERPAGYVSIEFLAGTNSVAQMLREVLRRSDEVVKNRGEYDLLAALTGAMVSDDDLAPVRQTDLRNVISLLYRSTQPGFVPPDRDQVMTFDPLRELAKRWLAGATLSATERKHLGVYSRLGTASMMTRVITELLAMAHRHRLIGGVLICVDEVEAIFSGQSSSGKTQAFLQDLRYLFDEAAKGDDGYSLMIVSASTNTGTTSLRDFNYPLYQRLGFEGEQRVQLEPISSLEEVKKFASEYIAYEQRRTAGGQGKTSSPSLTTFLSNDEYQEAYSIASSATRELSLKSLGSVNQGQLLEALHNVVQVKQGQG